MGNEKIVDDGGAAFPVPTGHAPKILRGGGHFNTATTGMSLGDYFAGQVLAGLDIEGIARTKFSDSIEDSLKEAVSYIARLSYDIADGMVVEKRRREWKRRQKRS